MPNFDKILDKNTSEIKKPPVMPAGTYLGTITSKVLGESSKKQTPFVEYKVQLTEAGEDVKERVAELGIDVTRKSFSGMSNKGGTFYLSDDSQYRVVAFAKTCGKNTDGKSLREVIELPIGEDVLCTITEVPSTSTEGEFFNNLDRMVGVKGAGNAA